MPPIALRAVPYGPPAAEALRAAVAEAKAGEPLAPVTVVVPSNHVGVTARRLLASGRAGAVSPQGRGLAGATFVTPYRLAELLGAAALAARGRRPVSTPVVAAAVRSALAAEPGLFAAVAEHPATESALVASYRELRDLPAGALDALARTGPRAADVVRLHRATRAALAPRWSDEEDLMAAAVRRLADDPGAAAELGAVVLYLPQALSLHVATLLRAVAAAAPTTVIVGTTGVAEADAEVRTGLARLGLEVDALPDAPLPVAPGRTRLVTTSDAEDEVRAAVRAVVAAAEAGTPLDRIAVLHPAPVPYGRLLHEHLAAAGIERNGSAVDPLATSIAGRVLTGLHELAATGWARHDVFSWLHAAPVLHEGRPAPVTRWERISRRAGIVGGRDQWDARLRTYATERSQRLAALEADGADAAALDRVRRDRDRALALRAFVLGLVDDVAATSSAPQRWRVHTGAAARALHRLLGGPARRQRWGDGPEADRERRAAERVELALDRLAALDEVEGPVGHDTFARTLAVELEDDLGRVGRFGRGVLVGGLALGVGLDLDLVVVLGLAEGTLPAPRRDDSLLPDRERRAVGGALALRGDDVGRQHRHLLAALASAGRQVLLQPRGDLRGSDERVPSRWLVEVAGALAGGPVAADALDTAPGVEPVPSFDAGLRRTPVLATDQEHRLRALLAAGAGPRSLDAVIGAGDEVLAAGARTVRARRSPELTRYDGNVAGAGVPSPADPEGRSPSATALEAWSRCPFAYFLGHVLGVREVENPEDELSITPMDRGTLVHEVLERFVLEVLARDERPGPDDRWSADDRARLRAIAEEVCDHFEAAGKTGRPLFWRRERALLLSELDQTLTFEEGARQVGGWRHRAAELAFGDPDEEHPTTLALPSGRTVRFRGKADRVDEADDGRLLVVDYKTGRSEGFARLSEDDPDLGGTHLQLAVYGAAARASVGRPDAPVRAEYWFTSARGRWRRVGYDLSDEVLERVGETLGLIVEGVEGGLFPPHPTDSDTSPWVECAACDPDGLGVADLRRAWQAKAADPRVAPYLTLIDPERRGPAPDGEPGPTVEPSSPAEARALAVEAGHG